MEKMQFIFRFSGSESSKMGLKYLIIRTKERN